MKPVSFLGGSLKKIRAFPDEVRLDIGQQIRRVQQGQQPTDFKPMASIGKGVEEVRVRDPEGTFRVIYTARLPEAVYVLHAFQKKTQATPKVDVDLARARFLRLMQERE